MAEQKQQQQQQDKDEFRSTDVRAISTKVNQIDYETTTVSVAR